MSILRIPGPIPIAIRPAFWVLALLIGFLNSGELLGTLAWVAIILLSVLVHEWGHALTALYFGKRPRIELMAMGGATFYEGADALPLRRQFLIVLNGPLFGFLLFLLSWSLYRLIGGGEGGRLLLWMARANLIWTLVNLLPILPMDGGQLLRILCESIFGFRGVRIALLTSALVAFGGALPAFLFGQILLGALLFLFAFQSLDAWRRTRHIAESDRDLLVKQLLERAELMRADEKAEEAMALLKEVRRRAGGGLSYESATQQLALLHYQRRETRAAYALLLPLKSSLSPSSLYLLYQAAFEVGNLALVDELGSLCFQSYPSGELALRNALAAAALRKTEAAVGWLETAHAEGVLHLDQLLRGEEFAPLRGDRRFQSFVQRLR